jgi:hypothetical protein
MVSNLPITLLEYHAYVGSVKIELQSRDGRHAVSLASGTNTIHYPQCTDLNASMQFVIDNYTEVVADLERVDYEPPSMQDYYSDNSRYYGD